MTRPVPARREALLSALVLGLVAGLPLLSLLGQPGHFLADPDSELPVKLWAHDHFWRVAGFLGGRVEVLAWPNPGPLNNADYVATAVLGLLKPFIGEAGAWNVLVWGTLWANMLSMWAAARARVGPAGALSAALAFGMTPLALAYGVMSAITDVLQLWPYPLAIHLGLKALRPEGRRIDALLSGALLGAGFLTCPYDILVFSPLVLPFLLWLPWGFREHEQKPPWGRWGRAVLLVGLGLLLVAGPMLGWTAFLMKAEGSQMSEETVALTRHQPPFDSLRPQEPDRYTAYLSDYVAIGKDALVVRDLGSRFYRAFSPGLVVLGLSLVGIVLRGRRREPLLWAGAALFFVLASTGPFLPLSSRLTYHQPVNPAWLACYWLLPGGKLLLEPFRYGLAAALCLGFAVGYGVDALFNRWRRTGLLYLVPGLILAELLLLSPIPWPLPVARPVVPPVYADLDEILAPGALIELPYFEAGSGIFYREHLLHQRVHGRPIGTVIEGLPPGWYLENELMLQLLAAEEPLPIFAIQSRNPSRLDEDAGQLAEVGFAGIIVTPSQYRSPQHAESVARLLSRFGPPIVRDDRWIYRLSPRSAEAPPGASSHPPRDPP